MPTASMKAMTAAEAPLFQSRVRFALTRAALLAIDDENSARADFARKVLTGGVNLYNAAVAVVANTSIGASIDGASDNDDSFGVADADIAYTVAQGDDPATGVFQKLARANAGV